MLNKEAQLSLEQGSDLNDFFGHSKEEAHFFLLLLQRDRAGNRNLRAYYDEQIQEILDRRLNLTARLGSSNSLSEEHKTTFYSSWHYLAVHIALTVPALQTKDALSAHFRLSLKKIAKILEFLTLSGLARQEGERYIADSSLLRIGNDTPHILKHHTNWRVKAVEALDREDLNDLHYSAVVSLSRSDVRALKNRMLEHIKEYVQTIRDSKEEQVYVLCLDWFEL